MESPPYLRFSADNAIGRFAGLLEPSDGLEPSTPSLPWRFRGVTRVHARSLGGVLLEDHAHHEHGHGGHAHDTAQGIEWEDDMVEVNRLTTPSNMRWKLVDRETGAENAQIDRTFRVGDR